MRKLLALVFLLTSVSMSSALAADGSSGCGPGWYVFKDNSLVSSSLRATTNGILGLTVTVGMTFGTSNCTKHSIVQTEKESLHFATMNYYELKSDIARGNGEHLAAFSQTIGCKPGSQKHFNGAMQSKYESIAPAGDTNPEHMMLEVYKVILTDPTLVQQCSLG